MYSKWKQERKKKRKTFVFINVRNVKYIGTSTIENRSSAVSRVLLNPIFWIVNPIQILCEFMIDSSKPNPVFKID